MHFDEQAINWDNDPKKIERAQIFAKEINAFIKPNRTLNALEFGCGTGLLSFNLKSAFKSIVLVDNSSEMIGVLKNKIEQQAIDNFIPLLVDITNQDIELPQQDVIYTLMTLHHILDLDRILGIFNQSLNPSGYLCIADLVEEDGSFHSHIKGFEGHNGFDKDNLNDILQRKGFRVVYYNECFEIKKETNSGIRVYPLFLLICQKES